MKKFIKIAAITLIIGLTLSLAYFLPYSKAKNLPSIPINKTIISQDIL